MALVGGLVLVLFLLVRPMELWPAVAQLHSLEVLTAITAIGIAIEALCGERLRAWSPQLGWLAAFLAWACATTMVKLGAADGLKAISDMILGPVFMVLVALALPKAGRLRAMATVLLACSAFVAAVVVHQGLQPRQCVEIRDESLTGAEQEIESVPDGRACEGPRQCEAGGSPYSDYVCERVGLVGSTSFAGRVRWRGQLDDPNEVAVFLGGLIPFLFLAEGWRARRVHSIVIVGIHLGLAVCAMVLTQSRGGQLVLGTVVMGMLVRRFGWWSVVLGLAATLPILLMTWRSDAGAEGSSQERTEILSEGLLLLRSSPILGVGVGQFAVENPLSMTAHNSYLLIATELGIPGYLIWCGLVWTTVKIPGTIAMRPPPGLDPSLARYADALAVSTIGLHLGIFFLSFVYKQVFFVWIGLAGALYCAVREQHPDFHVRTTRRDLVGICALAGAALVVVRIAALTAH